MAAAHPLTPPWSGRNSSARGRKAALTPNAAALIPSHNHPSGDPSRHATTSRRPREVKAAAEALGIAIHDHLVIGRKGHASFRSLGLLS
jgi:DNA repair protein RadC